MGRGWGWDRGSYWPPYVPVAERRAKAQAQLGKLRKKGEAVEPIRVTGNRIAHTFWGKAWCDNLLRYSDFSNRMPRGRSYVRNGHVLDLRIAAGKVSARVAGTRLYSIEIGIKKVDPKRWRAICRDCSGGIGSLVSLLQGRLSPEVMEVITRSGTGLFPEPAEIELSCSCPDWAVMCKHVAAALYGVGARLDERPELLFTLRGVDHLELIGGAVAAPLPAATPTERVLQGADLSGLFGIEVDDAPASKSTTSRRRQPAAHGANPAVRPDAPASTSTRRRREPTVVAAKPAANSSSTPRRRPVDPAIALARRYARLLGNFAGPVARRIRRLALRRGLSAAIAEMERILGQLD